MTPPPTSEIKLTDKQGYSLTTPLCVLLYKETCIESIRNKPRLGPSRTDNSNQTNDLRGVESSLLPHSRTTEPEMLNTWARTTQHLCQNRSMLGQNCSTYEPEPSKKLARTTQQLSQNHSKIKPEPFNSSHRALLAHHMGQNQPTLEPEPFRPRHRIFSFI